MDDSTDCRLRIANTPADGPRLNSDLGGDDGSLPAPAATKPPASSSSKQPRQRKGTTQKLTPDEMRLEIDRVNRLNGNIQPGIASGTHPDD